MLRAENRRKQSIVYERRKPPASETEPGICDDCAPNLTIADGPLTPSNSANPPYAAFGGHDPFDILILVTS